MRSRPAPVCLIGWRGRVPHETVKGAGAGLMRLPEGRYPSGRLAANVRADRSRAALTCGLREPDETPLRAADEVGRDVVATLMRSGTRKGTAGALGRLVDSSGRRYHREQLR